MEGDTPSARRQLDAVVGVAGVAILVLCAIPARSGTVGSFERSVFEAINGLPEKLLPFAQIAQFLGVLVVGPIVAVVALTLRRYRLAIAAVLVTVGKLAAERLVWQLIQRQRPGVTEPDAIVRGSTPENGLSFVSGHVVLVTGLAWISAPIRKAVGESFPGSLSASSRSLASTSARTTHSTSWEASRSASRSAGPRT